MPGTPRLEAPREPKVISPTAPALEGAAKSPSRNFLRPIGRRRGNDVTVRRARSGGGGELEGSLRNGSPATSTNAVHTTRRLACPPRSHTPGGAGHTPVRRR